jgi:hypothetical protein
MSRVAPQHSVLSWHVKGWNLLYYILLLIHTHFSLTFFWCCHLCIIVVLNITCVGPVYADGCYCPVKSVSDWLKEFGCRRSYNQINSDLEPFPRVNFTELRKTALQKFNHPGSMSICSYVVKDNQVMVK